MPVTRDICVLVVLVDVGYFNHYLKMLVSLLLYAMHRGVPRGLDLVQFRVLISMDTYKDKDSEVYFDLSHISWFERTLTCL